jgi:hypothetical protein
LDVGCGRTVYLIRVADMLQSVIWHNWRNWRNDSFLVRFVMPTSAGPSRSSHLLDGRSQVTVPPLPFFGWHIIITLFWGLRPLPVSLKAWVGCQKSVKCNFPFFYHCVGLDGIFIYLINSLKKYNSYNNK